MTQALKRVVMAHTLDTVAMTQTLERVVMAHTLVDTAIMTNPGESSYGTHP